MVSPPQYAKSVEVTNESKESIKVTVTYDDHVKKADITQSEDIAAGKTFHFVERTMDGDNTGKFQVVAPVKHVQVDGHKLTPSVNGVVAKLGVKASGDAGSVKLAQH